MVMEDYFRGWIERSNNIFVGTAIIEQVAHVHCTLEVDVAVLYVRKICFGPRMWEVLLSRMMYDKRNENKKLHPKDPAQ